MCSSLENFFKFFKVMTFSVMLKPIEVFLQIWFSSQISQQTQTWTINTVDMSSSDANCIWGYFWLDLWTDLNNILHHLGTRSFGPKAPAGFLVKISMFYQIWMNSDSIIIPISWILEHFLLKSEKINWKP